LVKVTSAAGIHGIRFAGHQRWGNRPARWWIADIDQACFGFVSNDCCDVSVLRGAAFKLSAGPLPPSKPAVACTSWPTLASSVGGSAAKPPSCQSNPTVPNSAAPVIWLLVML
jgi:hypothetical protein